RGGMFERHLDSFDNRTNRFGKALGDLTLADHNLFGHSVHQVAPFDLHHAALPVVRHASGPDLFFDPLSAAFANEKIMVASDVGDDRLIHFIASNSHR